MGSCEEESSIDCLDAIDIEIAYQCPNCMIIMCDVCAELHKANPKQWCLCPEE